MNTAGWEPFTRQGWRLEFTYPSVTPQGCEVVRKDERRGSAEGVHLSSPDGHELYIEFVRFADLAPRDEYMRHGDYLRQRFGSDSVAGLIETSVAGRPGWGYHFRGGDKERSALLLPLAGELYRIIYEPRSGLNAQVIATITIVD